MVPWVLLWWIKSHDGWLARRLLLECCAIAVLPVRVVKCGGTFGLMRKKSWAISGNVADSSIDGILHICQTCYFSTSMLYVKG